MKSTELGFKSVDGVLRWQQLGIAQVIPVDKKGLPHSYCQICVLAPDEPDPCVVCVLSWHQADLLILPSWDIASDTIAHRSKPGDEIPSDAVDVLVSMREPRAIYEWIERASGKEPPLRFWLAAASAYWAKEYQSALVAIERYRGFRLGPELLDRATRIKKIIEKEAAQ